MYEPRSHLTRRAPLRPSPLPCSPAHASLGAACLSRRANYDEDDFNDFLAQVEDVNKTILGLKDGSLDVNDITVDKVSEKQEKIAKEQAAKEAKRAKARAEAEAKAKAAADERARLEQLKEDNKEKLQELKESYYLRKARRERWLEFREMNRSRAFSDYYKGWDLFEEDPDEELFCDANNPAAVQDQGAFDAMAKDIEERTKTREASRAASNKEREAANLAFKAGQYTEALAGYSRAIEHFRGDKANFTNRAAAHLKLRNFLSALDDCSRAIEIASFLDNDTERRPPPPPLLKAYVRRAAAQVELGRHAEAADDLATALAMAPEAEKSEIKRQMKTLKEDEKAAKLEVDEAAAAGEKAVEMRSRVRELLGEVESHYLASAKELDELLEAATGAQREENGGAAAVFSFAAIAGLEAQAKPSGCTLRPRTITPFLRKNNAYDG